MAVACRMGPYPHYGQRAGTHSAQLRCVGLQIAHSTVLFQCDNTAVVVAVQKGTARDDLVMHLLHCLWFFTAYYDTTFTIEHIAEVANIAANQLSQNNTSFHRPTCC